MQHKERPVFGVQFHPELFDDAHPDGRQVLRTSLTSESLLLVSPGGADFDPPGPRFKPPDHPQATFFLPSYV
jgi:hypothetical protein